MVTFLEVQWLKLHASNIGGARSIPGQGTKIPHAAQGSQDIKKKTKTKNLLKNIHKHTYVHICSPFPLRANPP